MISFNSDFVLLPFRKGGGIMGEGTKILGILIIAAIIFFGKDNITSDKGGKVRAVAAVVPVVEVLRNANVSSIGACYFWCLYN